MLNCLSFRPEILRELAEHLAAKLRAVLIVKGESRHALDRIAFEPTQGFLDRGCGLVDGSFLATATSLSWF